MAASVVDAGMPGIRTIRVVLCDEGIGEAFPVAGGEEQRDAADQHDDTGRDVGLAESGVRAPDEPYPIQQGGDGEQRLPDPAVLEESDVVSGYS